MYKRRSCKVAREVWRGGHERRSQEDVPGKDVLSEVMRGAPDPVTESLMDNYGSNQVTFSNILKVRN